MALGVLLNYCSFFILKMEIQDWRINSNICSVHFVKMNEDIVHGLNGCIDPSLEYMMVSDSFPNHGIGYDKEMYSNEMGIIYVCPECLFNFKKWQSSRH